MEGLERFLRDIDEDLVCYKEEFIKLAVKSDSTLKYLRPHEVESMNIPPVYKRMLIDRIVNLQTPGTKEKLKQKCLDEFMLPKTPKRLKFGDLDAPISNANPTTVAERHERRSPAAAASRAPDNFLEQEVDRLNEERDTLSVLLVHKKDELNDLKQKPNLPSAISIPGNPITCKSSCDNCRRKGHRSIMNRGNKSCPFMKCEGYHACGQEGKHPDHKQSVTEAENVSKQNADIKPDSTGYSSPSASASAQQPLLQNSPFQMAQYNPYFPITSPTSPYQYVMYPNQWNSMYDVYGNGYPMYPANPMTSSTAPACAANPPLPLDSPPKNPPLPKD
uniref:Uncharacterized protein n=1 Tax=Magallana gigas TaxID=29159 RepID=A0A8W8ILI4_MAGGI